MKIKVALDWFPNAVHAGFYAALAKGWYEEAGLQVEFISPGSDSFSVSPIEKLFRKEVIFAVAPSEMVIRAHQSGYKELISVASILQKNISAIAVNKTLGIKKPAQLEGKKYAALNIPFEKAIIQSMVAGKYFETIVPGKEEIYDVLYSGKADFAWVYKTIEVIEAKEKGIELDVFDLEDQRIPYGHCPLLISHQEHIQNYSYNIQEFINITSRGYLFVKKEPLNATELITSKNKDLFPDKNLFGKTLEATLEYYLTEDKRWGVMTESKWDNFIYWLHEEGQINAAGMNKKWLYTNRFLVK